MGFPQLHVPNGYEGVNQCHFNFIWESCLACSPCKIEQAVLQNSQCEFGFRTVTAVRKDGE